MPPVAAQFLQNLVWLGFSIHVKFFEVARIVFCFSLSISLFIPSGHDFTLSVISVYFLFPCAPIFLGSGLCFFCQCNNRSTRCRNFFSLSQTIFHGFIFPA